MEHFLYNEQIPLIVIAPLHNFKCNFATSDEDSIQIDDGLLIRRITEEERNAFWNNMVFNHLPYGDIGKFDYVIEFKVNVTKFFSDWQKGSNSLEREFSIDRAQIMFDNVITSVRLLRPGAAGYSYIECKDTLNIPIRVGYFYSRGPFKVFGEDIFWLNKTDIPNIRQLYEDLKVVESSQNLALFLALERFNSAYYESSLEDKIIDFAISYEVLFLRQREGTDSISHKLAVRFARFISENYQERLSLYKTMKELYGKRSDIVHGNIKESNAQEKELVARDFEQNMRVSLKKYIERFKTGNYHEHSHLIQEIDFG